MRTALIAYCLGIYLVSLLPELSRELALVLASSWFCLFLLALASHSRMLRRTLTVVCMGLALGIVWHWSWGLRGLQSILPPQLEGQDLVVEGRVVGLPVSTSRGQRFALQLNARSALAADSKLQLSYFAPSAQDLTDGQVFRTGDLWRLSVRLKQPHGFANPGGTDREAYLFRNGFSATGYVRGVVDRELPQETGNRLLEYSRFSIAAWRYELLLKLQELLGNARYPDLLVALLLGERSQLDAGRWELFSETGTNHLFVISGLHIGLVTLFSFRVFGLGLRLLPAAHNMWPAQKSAALISMLVALCYSLLAGWGLPTQRACIMVLVLLSSYLTARQPDLGLRFLLALAFVLSLDPLAVTSMGFWLSFTAVAALLFCRQADRNPDETKGAKDRFLFNCWQYMCAQWAVFVGLILPLTLLLGQVSLLAPIANVVAVPVLGFVILPLLMVACVLILLMPSWSESLLLAADSVLHLLMGLLQFLAASFEQLARVSIELPPTAALFYIVPGFTLLLMQRKFPYRFLAVPLLASLVLGRSSVDSNGLRVHVLDVGQGLAVVIKTANHAMLYDTGPGIQGDWNAGMAVVVPALRHLGINNLDLILVSHGDADHAGGLAAISSAFPGAEIIANEWVHDAQNSCVNYPGWEWDAVKFTILHPREKTNSSQSLLSSNDSSCVLHVRSPGFSLLLPGDIEETLERELAMSLGAGLQSTVLVAAHHGSNTSSSYPFLKMVAAEQVVFASGYGNGFGHPAARVVQRHLALGAGLHNTASSGMVSFSPSLSADQLNVSHYRRDHRHYWAWSGYPPNCRYC